MQILEEIAIAFWSLFVEMSPYLLLGFLLAGVLEVLIPKQRLSQWLGQRNLKASFLAALAGVPLPLCSCGVIPTGVSLHKSGASKGAAISFLISTPQTGVDSLLVTWSLLGLPFAIVRPIVAFTTGVLGGQLTHRLTKNEVDNTATPQFIVKSTKHPVKRIFEYAFVEFLQDIAKWLLIGLLIAAIITTCIPVSFFDQYLSNSYLNMFIILLVSVPMYVCATGSIPIAAALMMKGISPGAAFVFLMAGPATNAGTITVIGKTLGRKSLIAYLTSIFSGAILSGIFINELLPANWFLLHHIAEGAHQHHQPTAWWEWSSAFLLAILLIHGIIRQRWPIQNNQQQFEQSDMKIKVEGMTCNHCKANVEKNLSQLPTIESATVDLASKQVNIKGSEISLVELEQTINDLGYNFIGKVEE